MRSDQKRINFITYWRFTLKPKINIEKVNYSNVGHIVLYWCCAVLNFTLKDGEQQSDYKYKIKVIQYQI